MMDEHIRSIFILNEPKTFFLAKPLNSSVGHSDFLLS
jgi:hypothetical protein